ncbi:MAG: hypothetical protein M3N82_00410 [Pseudomonadota bacterium]|nr:hypothetical protein [Pseudomonadota bacterium]
MSRMEITGFKRFKGSVDGKAIDSAKVFVRVKLDGSRNSADQRAEGYATEELRVDPAILKRIEHNPMPMICEVETERVSNGREAKDVVVDIRPVESAPAKPLKAA